MVVKIELPCHRAWFLNHARKLQPLRGTVTPPFPVGRFVVAETHDGCFKIEMPGAGRWQFRSHSRGLTLEATVQDRDGCGLVYYGREKVASCAEELTFNILWNRLDSVDECLWLEPYPRGAAAAVCITDHADFDTLENIPLLVDALLKHDVRITKTVFPVGQSGSPSYAGIDSPFYRNEMQRLYEHGSEIAFHGWGPRNECPPLEECQRRCESLMRFAPVTWTDHSGSDYLFSRKARLDSGEPLVGFLRQFGVTNFWSYFDVWNNPFSDVCTLPSGEYAPLPVYLARGVGLIEGCWRSPQLQAYVCAHAAKRAVGSRAYMRLVRKPWSRAAWRQAFEDGATMRRVRRAPLGLYGETGVSFFARDRDAILIFDTTYLTHLGAQLRPAAIDRLCRESGLLLAHTYLGAQHSYIRSNCLKRIRGHLQVHPQFEAALEDLGRRQRDGEVVSLPLRDLRRTLESFKRARLIRRPHGWELETDGAAAGNVAIAGSEKAWETIECDHRRWELRRGVGYLTSSGGETLGLRRSTREVR